MQFFWINDYKKFCKNYSRATENLSHEPTSQSHKVKTTLLTQICNNVQIKVICIISAPALQRGGWMSLQSCTGLSYVDQTELTSFCFTPLTPVLLLPPVGLTLKQCLGSRCFRTIVQPDINNNKPLAWMFSPFGNSGAIIISQSHSFWACLAPGTTTSRAVNIIFCNSLMWATQTLNPREKRGFSVCCLSKLKKSLFTKFDVKLIYICFSALTSARLRVERQVDNCFYVKFSKSFPTSLLNPSNPPPRPIQGEILALVQF